MVNCDNCGFDVSDSEFCPNCGTKVEQKILASSCPNCGFDVGDSAFCPNCGTKIEMEPVKSFCPNCGFDVGDSAFCPNCGTKIEMESVKSFCPNCGFDVGDSAFCPKCGTKINGEKEDLPSRVNNQSDENDIIDNVMDFDDKISSKLGGLFSKSKSMDKVLDKTASFRYNRMSKTTNNNMDRKYYGKIEPVFLEVYDSIDDEFVKDILLFERSMMMNGGVIGIVASQVYTPTKDMSHDDAVKFYQKRVNEIMVEVNKEKRNGTFDEEEFYKRKIKESTRDNVSFFGISKSVKAFRRNKN
nr:zinc ribbon domain-containing protein [uncultured Methanobrevibacter sp.]